MDNEIIIIGGFTNAGKDFSSNILVDRYGYNFVISTTSRPMRSYETQDDPYHFVDNKTFLQRVEDGKFIEYRSYEPKVKDGEQGVVWYYGVEKTEIKDNKKYVVVLDPLGTREFKKHFKDRAISFFLDLEEELRQRRNIDRGDYLKEEWNRRNKDDKERFTKEIIRRDFDYKVYSLRAMSVVDFILNVIGGSKNEI